MATSRSFACCPRTTEGSDWDTLFLWPRAHRRCWNLNGETDTLPVLTRKLPLLVNQCAPRKRTGPSAEGCHETARLSVRCWRSSASALDGSTANLQDALWVSRSSTKSWDSAASLAQRAAWDAGVSTHLAFATSRCTSLPRSSLPNAGQTLQPTKVPVDQDVRNFGKYRPWGRPGPLTCAQRAIQLGVLCV